MSKKLIAGAALIGLGAAAWGLAETRMFRIKRETIGILPVGSSAIRVLHISDIHMAPWQRAKQDWIATLASLRPDVVIATGDFLGHQDGLEGLSEALSPLSGIPGFYVFGSNDYYAPEPKNPLRYLIANSEPTSKEIRLDTDSLKTFLDNLGWHNLNNASASVEIVKSTGSETKISQKIRINALGTNDAHRGWDRLDLLSAAAEELQEEDANLEIDDADDINANENATITFGVTHAPYVRVLNTLTTLGAEVIFAGHTHGGQVRIPGLPPLVTNADLPREQAHGLSVWETTGKMSFLNVSAGLGTSIFAPVRFACPPEVSLIKLVAVN